MLGVLLGAGGDETGVLPMEPGAPTTTSRYWLPASGRACSIAFSAAATRDPAATGILVGRVATVGEEGWVAGPIAIGWRAQAMSLRLALDLVVVLALRTAAAADSTASSTAPVLRRQGTDGAR